MKTFRVLVLYAVLARGLPAQSATSPEITAADLRQRLFALAHDSMGGRATGSVGNFKAAEYVAAELRRVGLEPAGEAGTFFQTIPFFRLRPDVQLVLRVDGTPLALGRDIIPVSQPSLPRPVDGLKVILGGRLADSGSWIPAEQAAGKVVVLEARAPDRGMFRFVGLTARSPRFARAALLVLPVLDALGGESVASLMAGRVSTDTARSATLTPVALATRAAADRLLGRPLDAAEPGTVGRTVQGAIGTTLAPLPYPARNVVAVLRGSDPALRSQYVSVTAHNDHVGFDHSPVDHDSLRAFNQVMRPMGADTRARPPTAEEMRRVRTILDSLRRLRPPRPDSIRNGADDDGTGTVALVEIAERLASGARPRRSVLLVNHTAEEEGLLGSRWYTDHATVPVDSIVAEMDMDMVGRGGKADLPEGGPGYLEVIGWRRLSNEYGDVIAAVNARQPSPFSFQLAYDVPGHPLQYYCRADHYSYARYGIPSVSFSRGEHLDYHQVTDEPQYIDYDALERVTRFVADLALEVANRQGRPTLDQPKGDPRAPCVQ